MDSNELPRWLKVTLILLAVIFLGPPVLGILLGALGLALGIAAVGLKVGVVVLAIYALVLLIQRVLGSPRGKVTPLPAPPVDSLARAQAQLEFEDRQRKAQLDRELERALEQKQVFTAT